MEWFAPTDATLKRYLLGQLAPVRAERLERRYFTDEAVFERLLVVEEELLDAYVRGELPDPERALVAQHLLSHPSGQQRLRAARALQASLAQEQHRVTPEDGAPGPERRRPRTLIQWVTPLSVAVTTAVILLGVVAWLGVLNSRLSQQVSREQDQARAAAASETARAAQHATELQRARAARDASDRALAGLQRGGAVVVSMLTPGLLRDGEGAARVQVSPDTALVVLRLELRDPLPDVYRAVLRTVDGAEVWRQDPPSPLPDGERFVVLAVPARLLGPDDYLLTLQGRGRSGPLQDVSTYSFRVTELPSRRPH